MVYGTTMQATQTQTGSTPLLIYSSRKQKTYLVVEGRNKSRSLLPLSAVSSRKRLEQELGNECSRQEKWQQEKVAEPSIADIGMRNAVLIKPKIIPFLFM